MEERRKHPPECLRQEEWGEIKGFVEGTKEYRLSLCTKLDDIRRENKDRFEILIAQIRSNKVDSDIAVDKTNQDLISTKRTAGQVILWGVCSLITFAVAYGGLTTVVLDNTRKWHILEPEHQGLIRDVEVLKDKSYGYRGIKVVTDGKLS